MINYHTHCNLCKHAQGTITEYIEQAISDGFTVLGFSDHAPTADRSFSHMRMDLFNETAFYLNQLRELKVKYEDKIKIVIGLECEYLENSLDLYSFLLKSHLVDYLIATPSIFEMDGIYVNIHELPENADRDKLLTAYFKCTSNIISSGLFKVLAEPDLFYLFYNYMNDDIVMRFSDFADECAKRNALLEVNGLGINRRICNKNDADESIVDAFWFAMQQANVKVIAGADAHRPQDILPYYNLAVEKIKHYGLNSTDSVTG